jgi:hypothetical protein
MGCECFDILGHPSNVGEIAFERLWRGVVRLFAFSVQRAIPNTCVQVAPVSLLTKSAVEALPAALGAVTAA